MEFLRFSIFWILLCMVFCCQGSVTEETCLVVADTDNATSCRVIPRKPYPLTDYNKSSGVTIEYAEDFMGFNMTELFGGEICGTPAQFQEFERQITNASLIFGSCPACYQNFKTFIFLVMFHPRQRDFVQANFTMNLPKGHDEYNRLLNLTIFFDPEFIKGLFKSCETTVELNSGQRAMSIIDQSAASSPFAFVNAVGQRPETIYKMTFQDSSISNPPQDIKPLNWTIFPCHTGMYKCSCVDCVELCPAAEDWYSGSRYDCLLLGGYCWPVGFLIGYIVLVVALLVAGLMYYFFRHFRSNKVSATIITDEGNSSGTDSSKDDRNTTKIIKKAMDYRLRQYALDSAISLYFYRHGLYIARNPWKIIIATLILVALAGSSFLYLNFEIETDPARLWVGPKSDSANQKAYFDEHFGPFFRVQHIFITKVNPITGQREPILNPDGFKIARKVVSIAKSFANGTSYDFNKICHKQLGDECLIQSITEIWRDKTEFESLKSFEGPLKQWLTSPYSFNETLGRVPILPDVVLGGISKTSPKAGSSVFANHIKREPRPLLTISDYMNATTLICSFFIKNSLNNTQLEDAIKWETEFIEILKDLQVEIPGYQFVFSCGISIEKEINRDSKSNIIIVIMSYIIMFCYACMALGRFRSFRQLLVDSRASLALSGIFLVLVSILFSVVFFMAIHVKVTLIIAEVIPFLVLAVGIDNVFLIVHSFDRTDEKLPIDERVAQALESTGPNILLTGVTEILAFSAGGFVSMPAVSSFSLYAAFAIFCDFFLQTTCFVAFLTLDAYRSQSGRYDILFFLHYNNGKHTTELSELRYLEKLMALYHDKCLLYRRCKSLIIGLWISLLFFCSAGIFYIDLGLDQRIALPSDSYLIKYFDALRDDMLVGPPLYFVLRNVNYSSPKAQSHLLSRYFSDVSQYSIGAMIESNRHNPEAYIDTALSNWMDDYFQWLIYDCRYKLDKPDEKILTTPQSERILGEQGCLVLDEYNASVYSHPFVGDNFYKHFKHFMNTSFKTQIPYASIHKDSIHFDGIIKTSYFRTFFSPLRTQEDFIEALKASRKLCDRLMERNGNAFEVFPYSPHFIYFEQYLDIIYISAMLVSILLAAIFITNWILLGSLFMALIVLLMILSIVLCMLGIMGWWSISLSAVSLVNIVIAIGISVEFCSNIVRAYMVRFGSRYNRVKETLVETGSSVLSGITITKFLGVTVLAFSNSKIFVVFYFRMYLSVVVLGAFHSLVVLPVLLSCLGTKRVMVVKRKKKTRDNEIVVTAPTTENQS